MDETSPEFFGLVRVPYRDTHFKGRVEGLVLRLAGSNPVCNACRLRQQSLSKFFSRGAGQEESKSP